MNLNNVFVMGGWTEEAKAAAAERSKIQPKIIGWHHTDEAKQKMSEAKKGKPATNLGVPRIDTMKENDRIVALKRYLKRGRQCIKFLSERKWRY
jgi:hypothetical protein